MDFRHILSTALALSLSVPAHAQDAQSQAKLDAKLRAAEKWLDVYLEQEAVPGASVAIVHDQKIIWSKGFGYANLAGKVPATPQTRYSICSVSKLFTAIAAMQLRDQGKLDIDKPVGDYLSWYNIHDVEKPDGPVTARAIMSHVSGLPRESDTPYWSTASFPDLDTVKKRLSEQTNLYRAYDYLQYSNLGLTLLGQEVEAVSGQDYHAYVKAKLLDPIGLSSTTSELPKELHGKAFAVGYKARNGKGERATFPFYTVNAIAPAAGFASTVEDLGRFASWQFRVLEGGDPVLKSSTLREMQRVHWMTPDKPDETWGLGFAVYNQKGKTLVGHGGYCPGYRTSLMMRPQDKVAVIAMVNVNDVAPEAITRGLYDLLAGDIKAAYPDKPATTPTVAPKRDLSIYEGLYSRPGYDYDTYVVPYGDELIGVGLYAGNPSEDIDRYRHVEGDVFRRVRPDDSLAEPVRFEMGKDGKPVRMWTHSNPLDRVAGK
jgi:CubicO group peptidase (beta-lactamase class C family)